MNEPTCRSTFVASLSGTNLSGFQLVFNFMSWSYSISFLVFSSVLFEAFFLGPKIWGSTCFWHFGPGVEFWTSMLSLFCSSWGASHTRWQPAVTAGWSRLWLSGVLPYLAPWAIKALKFMEMDWEFMKSPVGCMVFVTVLLAFWLWCFRLRSELWWQWSWTSYWSTGGAFGWWVWLEWLEWSSFRKKIKERWFLHVHLPW